MINIIAVLMTIGTFILTFVFLILIYLFSKYDAKKANYNCEKCKNPICYYNYCLQKRKINERIIDEILNKKTYYLGDENKNEI